MNPLRTDSDFQGISSGRPPLFPLRYVDCEYPEDEEQSIDQDGNAELGCKFPLFSTICCQYLTVVCSLGVEISFYQRNSIPGE